MTKRELKKKVEERVAELILDERVFQRQPNTFVLLRIGVNGGVEELFGFSKVMYPDRWDAERGAELAKQKAIAAYAKEMVTEHGKRALEEIHG